MNFSVFFVLFCFFSASVLSKHCDEKDNKELIDCLKQQIDDHRPEPLSHSDFMKLLENERISQQQADELVNHAYDRDISSPILFRKAPEIISSNNYSLNFLWIHKEKLEGPGHLLGTDDSKLTEKVLNPLIDWQSKQPEANINFWYDGQFINRENIESTINLIKDKKINEAKISFRDIREIPFVKSNPKLFAPEIQVYLRVDLAKAVIADYVMRFDKLPFVVNIDSDIVAIVPAQLFDEPTLYALKNIGYSFGSANGAHEENSFIILHNNDDIKTLEAHYTYIIESAKNDAEIVLKSGYKPSEQAVFSKYNGFKTAMRMGVQQKTGKKWTSQNIQVYGKPMIFPPSQFGVLGGYSTPMIKALKEALAK